MCCLRFDQESRLKQLVLTANQESLLILLKKELLEEIFVAFSCQYLLASAVVFLINGKTYFIIARIANFLLEYGGIIFAVNKI